MTRILYISFIKCAPCNADPCLLQYLISDDFKAKMSVLVDDLVTDPKTPTYVWILSVVSLPKLTVIVQPQ